MEHGGKTYNGSAKRKRFNAKYNSAVWSKIRVAQLSRQPLCQSCSLKGRVTLATVVDHVFPWSQIGDHAFVINKYQSLCHECHSVKTNLEQQGICRHYVDKPVDYSIKDWSHVTLST